MMKVMTLIMGMIKIYNNNNDNNDDDNDNSNNNILYAVQQKQEIGTERCKIQLFMRLV